MTQFQTPWHAARHDEGMVKLMATYEKCRHLFKKGINRTDLEVAMGRDKSAMTYFLRKASRAGLIVTNNNKRFALYFLTVEDVEKWRVWWEKDRYERKKAGVMKRYWAMRAKLPPKPVKFCLPPSEKKATSPAAKFKALPAYHPKDVKTQYCPAGIDHRHTAVEPFPKVFSSLPIGVYL